MKIFSDLSRKNCVVLQCVCAFTKMIHINIVTPLRCILTNVWFSKYIHHLTANVENHLEYDGVIHFQMYHT